MWKLAAMIVVVLAVAGGACGRDTGGTLAKIKERGVITYGADLQGGEPYLWEENGKLVGFETELMDAIARRLGAKAEMVQTNWSNLIDSLDRGDFDIIFNGLEAKGNLVDRIRLSKPYMIYAETLAVRKDSSARYLFDLAGKRVATLNQTYAWDLLRMISTITTVPYEGNDEPYDDLEHGRVDGVLLDNIIAERFGCVSKHPNVMCLEADVTRGAYAAGIRKEDPELQQAIDDVIEAMRKDGELERILRKANLWDFRQTEARGVSVSDPTVRSFDLDMFQDFVAAAIVTLEISVLGFLLAVPIGIALAISRVYGPLWLRGAARGYIELFRGTPVLLQLYVMYYTLGYVILLSPMTVAVLTLGLNYGAYEAEVYRGALLAIPRGQSEAAKALGLGPWQTLRHVLLPQALRIALPPMTNDFVSLLKDSSIVSIITVIELTKRMTIAAVDLRGYLVAGIACALFYLVLSVPLSELARRLERRLARDQRPHAL